MRIVCWGDSMKFKTYDTGNNNDLYTKHEFNPERSNDNYIGNSKPNTNSQASFNSYDTKEEVNNEKVIQSTNTIKSATTIKKKAAIVKKLSTVFMATVVGGNVALGGAILGQATKQFKATINEEEIGYHEAFVFIETNEGHYMIDEDYYYTDPEYDSLNPIEEDKETEIEELSYTPYKVVCESRDNLTYNYEYEELYGSQSLFFEGLESGTRYKMYLLSGGNLIDTYYFTTLKEVDEPVGPIDPITTTSPPMTQVPVTTTIIPTTTTSRTTIVETTTVPVTTTIVPTTTIPVTTANIYSELGEGLIDVRIIEDGTLLVFFVDYIEREIGFERGFFIATNSPLDEFEVNPTDGSINFEPYSLSFEDNSDGNYCNISELDETFYIIVYAKYIDPNADPTTSEPGTTSSDSDEYAYDYKKVYELNKGDYI